jgi:hypothetical protein
MPIGFLLPGFPKSRDLARGTLRPRVADEMRLVGGFDLLTLSSLAGTPYPSSVKRLERMSAQCVGGTESSN